jgi:FdhD protein
MDTEDRLSIPRPKGRVRTQVVRVEKGLHSTTSDGVVGEEPLEMRIRAGGVRRTLGVTMRTPGNDFELVAGFLKSEGIVGGRGDIGSIRYCTDPDIDEAQMYNVVTAELTSGVVRDVAPRRFHSGSACGVCGKSTLDELSLDGHEPVSSDVRIAPSAVYSLPDRLLARQRLFGATGGLHAAGLFDIAGEPLAVREDVGRHNALDKLLGWALLAGRPLEDAIVMVSGRVGFEIAQKCLASRVPTLCAVSAPSSLAVDLARRFGMTLIGFLRADRFNVYSGHERVAAGG